MRAAHAETDQPDPTGHNSCTRFLGGYNSLSKEREMYGTAGNVTIRLAQPRSLCHRRTQPCGKFCWIMPGYQPTREAGRAESGDRLFIAADKLEDVTAIDELL